MPSASDWSMPQGPCRLGPMRSCIQATTLRSHTMENSTVTIRKAKQKTALTTTSHQGSRPNIERSSAARYGAHASTSSGVPRWRASPGRCGRGRRAAPRCRRRRRRPVEFSGSQTTRSGISVICSGSSTAPARAGDGEDVAVLDARLGGRGGRQPGDARRAGCRRAPRRRPGAGPGRAAAGARRAPPRPAAGPGQRAAVSSGAVAARAVPGAEPVELARARSRTSGRPRCDVQGVGQHVQHPARRRVRGGGSSGRA